MSTIQLHPARTSSHLPTPQGALLHHYVNGGYAVDLYNDGTKIRTPLHSSNPIADWPEQMDLKITDWCDAGCGWCHEESTTAGQHANIERTLQVLTGLHPGTEIAIGGGDPLSHPMFAEFVQELRIRQLVPSVTINGRHFQRSLPLLEKLIAQGNLFGVGVSYFNSTIDWDYPNMVQHVITGINHPSLFLKSNLTRQKLLLLGYKTFGRGRQIMSLQPDFIADNISAWYRALHLVCQQHQVSFDNLAIEQLQPRRLFPSSKTYQSLYMGEEGLFSMYVDAVKETFALCSYAEERHPWTSEGSLLNIRPMFQTIRTLQHG